MISTSGYAFITRDPLLLVSTKRKAGGLIFFHHFLKI